MSSNDTYDIIFSKISLIKNILCGSLDTLDWPRDGNRKDGSDLFFKSDQMLDIDKVLLGIKVNIRLIFTWDKRR